MNRYIPYNSKIFNTYSGREDIEWSNNWIDKANDENTRKRILLVGDSTMRMVRSKLANYLKCPVDLIASSYALHDRLFVEEVNLFFNYSIYSYDAIYVQVGVHNWVGENGEIYSDEDYILFERNLNLLIEFLKQFTKKIILETVFLEVCSKSRLGYYLCKFKLKKEKLGSAEINGVRNKKNIIIRNFKKDKFVNILDIQNIVDARNFIRTDHIHYEKRAITFIVKEMVKFL